MTTLPPPPPPTPAADPFAPPDLSGPRFREAHARFLEQDAEQWKRLADASGTGWYDADRDRNYAQILRSRAAMIREGKADLP